MLSALNLVELSVCRLASVQEALLSLSVTSVGRTEKVGHRCQGNFSSRGRVSAKQTQDPAD